MIVGAILILAPAAAAAPFMMGSASWSTQPEQTVARGSQADEAGAPGKAPDVTIANVTAHPPADCRYSIVPGGVYSRADVLAAMERDPVVAAHYSFVHIPSLREQRAEGRMVYVSYRVGDEVYWTHERVALEPGELVLTDGSNEIRASCGNLVSDNQRRDTALPWPVYLSMIGIGDDETGSPSTTTAASGDLIDPIGNAGPGGSVPDPRTPFGSVIPVPAGQPGGSDSGEGGAGGGTGGGTGGGGVGGGGGNSGGGNANDGSSSGGSGSGNDSRSGGSEGSGDEGNNPGNGNPGGGIDQGGTGSSGGDSPSSPNSNQDQPGTGSTGGPGSPVTETDKPSRILDPQSDVHGDQPVVAVPEPTSLSLLVLGFGAAALAGRRNRKR